MMSFWLENIPGNGLGLLWPPWLTLAKPVPDTGFGWVRPVIWCVGRCWVDQNREGRTGSL